MLTKTTGRVDLDVDLAEFERRISKLEGAKPTPSSKPAAPATHISPAPPPLLRVQSADGTVLVPTSTLEVNTTYGLTLAQDGAYAEIGLANTMRACLSNGSRFTRDAINFIPGTNITLTVADDPTHNTVDVTITSTASGGFTDPMTTKGDMIYSSDGTPTPARLAVGSGSQVLGVSGGVPAWGAVPALTALTGQVTASGTGSQTATITPGSNGQQMKTEGGVTAWTNDPAVIGGVFDAGASALTSGLIARCYVPFGGTITAVTIASDQVGSAVVDIWVAADASYPPTVGNTITASAKPTLAASQHVTSTSLTGWTTTIAAGSWIFFHLDSVSTCDQVVVALTVNKA